MADDVPCNRDESVVVFPLKKVFGRSILLLEEVLVDADGVVVSLSRDWVREGIHPDESLRLVSMFLWEMCLLKVTARDVGCVLRIF